jgi:hypothetical protein
MDLLIVCALALSLPLADIDAIVAKELTELKSAPWCDKDVSGAIDRVQLSVASAAAIVPDWSKPLLYQTLTERLAGIRQQVDQYSTKDYQVAAAGSELATLLIWVNSVELAKWPDEEAYHALRERHQSVLVKLVDLIELKGKGWPNAVKTLIVKELRQRYLQYTMTPTSVGGMLHVDDKLMGKLEKEIGDFCTLMTKYYADNPTEPDLTERDLNGQPRPSDGLNDPDGDIDSGISAVDQGFIFQQLFAVEQFMNASFSEASYESGVMVPVAVVKERFPDNVATIGHWGRAVHAAEAAENNAHQAKIQKQNEAIIADSQDPERIRKAQEQFAEQALRENGPTPELRFRRSKHTSDPPPVPIRENRIGWWLFWFNLLVILVVCGVRIHHGRRNSQQNVDAP